MWSVYHDIHAFYCEDDAFVISDREIVIQSSDVINVVPPPTFTCILKMDSYRLSPLERDVCALYVHEI